MSCWQNTRSQNEETGQQLGAGDAGLRLCFISESSARRA